MPELPPYGLILDIFLILAIGGLWLVWWRNLNRLHKTEGLLAESIQQLDLATAQLQQAMEHIRALEKQDKSTQNRRPSATRRTQQTASSAPSNDTVLARTLRLERQGRSAEEIADTLNIPVSQVRLMLKVHTAKSA